jgi:hypothetical protein
MRQINAQQGGVVLRWRQHQSRLRPHGALGVDASGGDDAIHHGDGGLGLSIQRVELVRRAIGEGAGLGFGGAAGGGQSGVLRLDCAETGLRAGEGGLQRAGLMRRGGLACQRAKKASGEATDQMTSTAMAPAMAH